MIVPEQFRPHIRVTYPDNNHPIFEEWLYGDDNRAEYLPIFWTSYWVNNDYGNDRRAKAALQAFVDSLPRDRQYWTVVQYDDGCLVDFKDLDILIFSMSGHGYDIPLICQPHPYTFNVERTVFYSYVGSNTHPIRKQIKQTTTKRLNIKEYCQLMASSVFALCPRGYGANSFRTCEALQYGAIPVYISDKFVECFDVDFNEFGVKITPDQVGNIDAILRKITPEEIDQKRKRGREVYEQYYTFQGCRNEILKRV